MYRRSACWPDRLEGARSISSSDAVSLSVPNAALRPIVLAVHLAVTGTLCSALAWAPSTHAQQAGAEQARRYSIPAGSLNAVLNRFAQEAGVLLSAPGKLTAGKSSPGLDGSYSVQAGFSVLLAGSGLEAFPQGDGSYGLRTMPATEANEARQLVPVLVTSAGLGDGTTEETGSYAPVGAVGIATPLGLTARETPQSISVMTNQRFEDQGLTTIRETLAQAPGLALVSSGTERFQATSRGYQITNYQLDGISTHSDYGGAAGPASQSVADMAIYDRIELVRGASGLMTGAGDPSGAINMVRKKPTREARATIDVALGTWNDKRGVLDLSGPLNEAGTLRGRFVGAAQNTGGFIDHYHHDKKLVYGVLEADLGSRSRLTLGVDHQSTKSKGSSTYAGFPLWFSDGEQTDLPVSTSLASRDNRFETDATTAFAAFEHELDNAWHFKVSGTRGDSRQREQSVYLDANGFFADRLTGDGLIIDAAGRTYDTRFSTVDVNLRGSFGLLGRRHEAVFGLAYEDYQKIADGYFDTSGLDGQPANLYSWNRSGRAVFDLKAIDWDAYREQYSFYAAGRFALADRLKLIVGTRVINYEDRLYTANIYGYRYEPASSEKGVFAPYGGLVYDIDGTHTAYFSFSTIYQPQYYRDLDGNLIDPREGENYEIGVKSAWFGGKLNSAVAIYRIDQENLTETDPAYILVPGTTSEYASRVIPGARTRGVDLELTGALTSRWNLSASYTYSKTENGDGEAVRTTFPRHIVKLWTTYSLSGQLSGLTIGGGVNWQSRIHSTIYSWALDRDLHWEQKSHALFGLMARYRFSDSMSVTLHVNNLFDKKYIASANDWWYSGNFGAPRSVAVNLRYRF